LQSELRQDVLNILFSSSNSTSNTRTSVPSEERRQPRYTEPYSTNDPRFPDVGGSDLYPVRGDGLRGPG
jgi:hypothetical protein